MIKELISTKTNDSINRVVQLCFNGNAIADNVVYNLDVVFNMVQANDIVHHAFAHWFPVYADSFNDIQRIQNMKPVRLPVEGATKQYDNFVECFDDLEVFMLDVLEPAIKDAIRSAEENNDVKTRILLENAYTDIALYTKQVMIWRDKAEEYLVNTGGGQSFDKDFRVFTIIPIPD